MEGDAGNPTETYISFLWSPPNDHVLHLQVEELELEHGRRLGIEDIDINMQTGCAYESGVGDEQRSSSERLPDYAAEEHVKIHTKFGLLK